MSSSAPTDAPDVAIPAAPRPPSTLSNIGRAALDMAETARGLYSLFVRTLYYCVRGRREPGAVLFYMYEIGNRSLFFVTVVMGFLGMISIYQSGVQALRILPDLRLMGATFLELLTRDVAATIGALMLATRVGAGIAAEIGSMVVTEQVDALRMCAADPVDYLIKPRFIASMIMTTILLIWCGFVAFVAGLITANVYFDVNAETFINFQMVDAVDLGTGLVKCLAYGAAIPIVAGHAGLSTFGGSEGVGWATTRAVVNCCLAVLILDVFISAASFLMFG